MDRPSFSRRNVSTTSPEQDEIIDLRDPALAAFLAWLVPGLGHLYQRRYFKSALYFVLIFGTFVYGCYLGGSRELGWARVVYASLRNEDYRLYYFCQLGVGLPAMPALLQANRVRNGSPPLWNGFMAPPQLSAGGGEPTIDTLNKLLHRFFELGTVYTMIAGLLNILAIYDAWGGPVMPEASDEEDEQ